MAAGRVCDNYNGIPIPPRNAARIRETVIYLVPVVAPGNLMFYRGTQTFPSGTADRVELRGQLVYKPVPATASPARRVPAS